MVGIDVSAAELEIARTENPWAQTYQPQDAPADLSADIAYSNGNQVMADLRIIMTKQLLITGSTLRSRSVAEKSSLARAVEQQVWPLFTSGQLRPVVDRVFPFSEAREAYRYLESGAHFGKVCIAI